MSDRIAYLSWPATEITGGIKIVFRHVETLRAAGFDAVVATAGGQWPEWFESDAPVVDLQEVRRGTDALVFPENHCGLLRDFESWPNHKVVLCQNQFMVCRGVHGRASYGDYGVTDVICVGRQVAAFCQRRFPDLDLVIVPICVDHELFRFQERKKVQIAFMPRKRTLEAAVINDYFRAVYPEFRAVPWIPIVGQPAHQVARILRDSALFLSLCRFEAVALSLLEAMACGCICAGFTGQGARDYTTVSNGFWADEDDCETSADKLYQAFQLVTGGGSNYHDMVEDSLRTANVFNAQRFSHKLVQFWTRHLSPSIPAEIRTELPAASH